MKYLIISDAASMHIYNFIKNSLLGRGYDIYILRHSVMDIPEEYRVFYEENDITVFSPGKSTDKRTHFFTTLRFFKKCAFLMKLGKVDVCHIHYAHQSSCVLYKMFRFNFRKMILSFWGTDILNPPKNEAKQQVSVLKYADAITCTVEHTKEIFRQRFGQKYDSKLFFGRFAAGALSFIKKYSTQISREECRKSFNIPDGKICVVCGYNANTAQHQDIILNEFSQLPTEYIEKIHLIIPMQYNVIDSDYVMHVKSLAASCGYTYDILEEYVPFERNAQLSLATDIYLNFRDTDAFSNAMKEQLYAGSLMIQGSWLVYEELDQIKANVIKIDSIIQLHEIIPSIIDNYIIPSDHQLFEPLYKIFSIESARHSWDNVLNKVGVYNG